MHALLIALFLSSPSPAATMGGKTIRIHGGIAVGDCAAQSTDKVYTCKTPHSNLPLILKFSSDDEPYTRWSQAYHIGDNWVRGTFEIYDDGDSFDITLALTIEGPQALNNETTVTVKTLDDFQKIHMSSPPLPTPQGLKVVDLTIKK